MIELTTALRSEWVPGAIGAACGGAGSSEWGQSLLALHSHSSSFSEVTGGVPFNDVVAGGSVKLGTNRCMLACMQREQTKIDSSGLMECVWACMHVN